MFLSITPDERASHFGITLIFPAGRSPSLAAAFKFGFGWPAAMFAEVCVSVLDRLRRLEVSVGELFQRLSKLQSHVYKDMVPEGRYRLGR
jgi:hypothetical protein